MLYRPRHSLVARLVTLVRHVFTATAGHCYVCGRVMPQRGDAGAVSRVCANDLCQFQLVETPKYWCAGGSNILPLPPPDLCAATNA